MNHYFLLPYYPSRSQHHHCLLPPAVRRYCCFVFEMVYVKHMCESVKMSNWGRVYYTNDL